MGFCAYCRSYLIWSPVILHSATNHQPCENAPTLLNDQQPTDHNTQPTHDYPSKQPTDPNHLTKQPKLPSIDKADQHQPTSKNTLQAFSFTPHAYVDHQPNQQIPRPINDNHHHSTNRPTNKLHPSLPTPPGIISAIPSRAATPPRSFMPITHAERLNNQRSINNQSKGQ